MAVKKKGLGRGLDGLFTSYKDSTEEKTKDSSAKTQDLPEKKAKGSAKSNNAKGSSEKNGTVKGNKDTEKKSEKKASRTVPKPSAPAPEKETEGSVVSVKISRVEPNREQPRKDFKEEGLEELAESIRQFGVIQPLLVQKREDYYEIIAGERRWRAARMAGLKEIPVIIKDYSEQEIVEVSLIENIQREDLNPIEEAKAYQRLLQEFDLKQEDVAKRVSKNRSTITNSLRLLKLNEEVQNMLSDGEISSGHARALLAVEDPALQLEIAKRVTKERLSVRDIEKLMKSVSSSAKKPKKETKKDQAFELVCRDMEEKMKISLGTKVSVNARSRNAGKIEIEYYSRDELERLFDLLKSV